MSSGGGHPDAVRRGADSSPEETLGEHFVGTPRGAAPPTAWRSTSLFEVRIVPKTGLRIGSSGWAGRTMGGRNMANVLRPSRWPSATLPNAERADGRGERRSSAVRP